MKKTVFVLLLTFLLVGFATHEALAFSFRTAYTGPLFFKVTDFTDSTIYTGTTPGGVSGVGNVDALPQTRPANPFNGEDSWGVFKITEVRALNGPQTLLWADGDNGEELTGMFYGIQDIYVNQPGGGLPGHIDSAGIPPNGGVSGIHIDMYLDAAQNYNPSLGPGARVSQTTYPTATDGSLFLAGVFNAGQLHAAGDGGGVETAFHEIVLQSNPFVGIGNGFVELTAGSHLSLFDFNNPVGTFPFGGGVPGTGTADFFLTINADAANAQFGWTTASNDPVRGAAVPPVIPEPTTMLLLGSGLLGLAAYGKKRFKK